MAMKQAFWMVFGYAVAALILLPCWPSLGRCWSQRFFQGDIR